MASNPTSTSVQLILKCSTTTLFLFTTPSSTLLSLKTQIASMLESNSAHLAKSIRIPNSPAEILIGVPRETELKKGFVDLEAPQDVKGNKVSVSAAGLQDGGVYAFRVVKGDDEDKDEFDVQFPEDDYGDSQQ